MPVNIGDQPDHGFDQPLGLMRDCHRRVEKFLGVLLHIARHAQGGKLDQEHSAAMDAALRYFENAAPWHTRDEEDSLFPRMRKLDDHEARGALARIDALESDHLDAQAKHAEVDDLGRTWLAEESLAAAPLARLVWLLEQLQATYARHIAQEDDVIFPLAEKLLPAGSIAAIGREMADRRGVPHDLPPNRCKHARK